ncbi:MAG: CehA/McbA family metallohydrolase [Hyphomonadaceae bacterium]
MRALPFSVLFVLLSACATQGAPLASNATANPPDAIAGKATNGGSKTIVINGSVTPDLFPSYIELPFEVPPGVERVTIQVEHEFKGQGVVLDLGLRDPNGQRGWSGSNKRELTVSAWDATPSFRVGAVVPGEWTLVMGLPAYRKDRPKADYTATIRLDFASPDTPSSPAIPPGPISAEPGWRYGDLHNHTGHSDGSCKATTGLRVPCPTIRTLEAAHDAKLDFVAVTDHNTLAQLADLAALAPAFPDLLVIPGTEVTTFKGHANALGLSRPVEFQLGTDRLPTIDDLIDNVEAQHAILSINHPGLATGPICMGCGWNADTDWSRIPSIEVVNGGLLRNGQEEGPFSGIRYWENLLNQGYRITAVGGSDNHDATVRSMAQQSPVGRPATAVYAQTLSIDGVNAAIRSGRVFLDLDGRTDRVLDLAFVSNGAPIHMGGELVLPEGERSTGRIVTTNASGLKIDVHAHNAKAVASSDVVPQSSEISLEVEGGAEGGWVRVDLRDPETGRLILLGNPVYVAPSASDGA